MGVLRSMSSFSPARTGHVVEATLTNRKTIWLAVCDWHEHEIISGRSPFTDGKQLDQLRAELPSTEHRRQHAVFMAESVWMEKHWLTARKNNTMRNWDGSIFLRLLMLLWYLSFIYYLFAIRILQANAFSFRPRHGRIHLAHGCINRYLFTSILGFSSLYSNKYTVTRWLAMIRDTSLERKFLSCIVNVETFQVCSWCHVQNKDTSMRPCCYRAIHE